ncbi:MAG: hypothetical protein ACK4SB_11010 [Belliella pelovolcani]
MPILKWKGYEQSCKELEDWCMETGLMITQHFETDPVQPNWLTLYTGEKFSGGRGSSYRVLPGMYIVKLPSSWPFVMGYSKEEVVKIFRKE